MHEGLNSNQTEAVLLVDADNGFNSMNRKILLHNIHENMSIYLYVYIYNCYNVPTRLFLIGGKGISSREGTTQGDPTEMATYALGLQSSTQVFETTAKKGVVPVVTNNLTLF